jgi:zinc transport system substrate-binding protein
MIKILIGFIIGLSLVAVMSDGLKAGIFSNEAAVRTSQQTQSTKIMVVTSFYPLYDFAKNVAGDHVEVINITPAGAEPHDYEPTPQDIAKIYKAKLFIFNGNGIDSWGDKIQSDVKNKGVEVLKISDHLESLKKNAPEKGKSNPYDPHFWLDPINATKETDLIADALIRIDDHQTEYNQNRNNFKKRLADLDQEYTAALTHCRLREIVVSHNAFNYLSNRYNLTTLYISGLTPDEEPLPYRMAEIVTLVKQKNIKYIFFETLVSPKLAETIASEVGAKTLVLNPIEGLTAQEIAQGKNYISVMKDNLSNLRIALQCQ